MLEQIAEAVGSCLLESSSEWIVDHSSFSILSPQRFRAVSMKTALSQMKDESLGGGHWEATDYEA
jgi:hypothetical protein